MLNQDNNKQRVFLAARKRGIQPSTVRQMLSDAGAPPTLSEVGEQRSTYMGQYGAYSYRNSDDGRDISGYLANKMINKLDSMTVLVFKQKTA